MKHYLMLLPFCILAGQAQDIQWEQSYGGRQADYLFDVQPTADYGFIIAGSSLSVPSGNKTQASNGDLDYCIWKMDEHGKEDWQKTFGGSGSDFLMSVRCTADGGFVLGGTSSSPVYPHPQPLSNAPKYREGGRTAPSFGGNDYWVIKLNAKGEQEWQQSYGGSGQDDLVAVVPTRDGGYLIGGNSASSPAGPAPSEPGGGTPKGQKWDVSRGNMDYWIIKVDGKGDVQWQHTYGGQYADLLKSMEQTVDGGYILGGYSNSSTAQGNSTAQGSSTTFGVTGGYEKTEDNFGKGNDFWILKLNKDGHIEWQRTLGGDRDDQLFAIHQTYDKGYIVGGNSNSGATGNKSTTNKGGTDFWVLKLDDKGNTDWQQVYDFGKADVLTSVVENEDHSFLIGGFAQSEKTKDNEGINDYIVLKISEKGENLWDKSVGSDGEDILRKAIMTRDGGYLLAGTSNPENKGKSRKSKVESKKTVGGVDTSGQLAGAEKAQAAVDGAVQDATQTANDYVKDQANGVADGAKKAVGQDNHSRVKVGVGPVGDVLSSGKGGNDKGGNGGSGTAQQGPKPGLSASRDKTTNYGGKDFWIVKLKDKDKKDKDPKAVEAFPNPATTFTNVVIGFDFDKGTAELYDLAGRQLQSFKIDSRTVPVDLSSYPEGIYIVKVRTNKGEGSMKIIKN
ncbi:MAG: hypothetical protein CFE23_14610 [Flavobacterium sp. BFFFF1]|uniref:T9SS type A sorting domain-containing protein n=1 Tax=Flavobacterium sp. BFFFF1 TaxID=2015557 RepID=UPI000BCCAAFD|nr:T9SS type A sorting domain-containing protein [Flavobacterium sp. BFFFF1]OYU79334.1 MAG: hypothetical protein CFE23_14610 [Flavobacterium sp. BFFFF1]